MANDITGTALNDSLLGSYENDTLTGLDGNDTLDGLAGSDYLDGGAGDDSLNSTGSNGNYYSYYNSQPTSSTLVGGAGSDSLNASWQSQASLSGGDDNDSLSVNVVRSATLEGGAGSDNLNVGYYGNYSQYTDGNRQAAESYRLDGGDGDDSLTVTGYSTNDSWGNRDGEATATLLGGAGNDRLEARDWAASSSNNYYGMSAASLDGGEGNDALIAAGVLQATLTGGAGADTFVLTGTQYDTQRSGDHQIVLEDGTWKTVTPAPLLITDFQVGAGGDQLDLADLLNSLGFNSSQFDPFVAGRMSLAQSGADTQLMLDGNVVAVLQGVTASQMGTANSTQQYDFQYQPGSRVTLTGTSDADSLTGNNRNEDFYGQDGNDTLNGSAGNDYLDGGAGDDSLNSTGSNGSYYSSYMAQPMSSTLVGGAGNDSLNASWQSQASLAGGEENDSLSVSAVRSATLEGGTGSDSLNVNYNGNYSQYTDGNQQASESYRLDGGEGDDNLTVAGYSTNHPSGYGEGEATATLLGGAGNDRLEVRDYNAGGSNSYGMSAASLDGGEGNDTLITAGVLQATLTGGAGSDTFALTWQQYTLQQSGAHQIAQADGTSKAMMPALLLITDFQAGVGGDLLDLVDLLNGLGFNNSPFDPFAAGRMSLVQSGADTQLMLDGNVVAVLQGVTASEMGAANFTQRYDFQYQPGSRITLTGTPDTDSLTGNNRNEDLYGFDGNDTLDGGAGSDYLNGGAGDDTLNSIGSSGNHYSAYMTGPMSSTLVGGAGNDSLNASWQSQASLAGGEDNDSLSVSAVGSATLEGGAGSDSLNVYYSGYYSQYTDGNQQAPESYRLDGGEGDDNLIVAGYSTNHPWGYGEGEASATLLGGAGNDRLEARDYNAGGSNSYGMSAVSLDGGEGNDTLIASGVLQATLTGGAGSDTFVLTGQQYNTQQSGTHQIAQADGTFKTVTPAPLLITDFQAGVGGDKLDLGDLVNNLDWWSYVDYGNNPFADGRLSLVQSGADTQLKVDGNVAAVLKGVVAADLRADNLTQQYQLPQTFGFANLDDTGATDHVTRDNSFELTARTPSTDYGLVFEKSTDGGASWSVTDAQQSGLADGHYEYRARLGGLKVGQQGAIRVEQTQEANGDLTLRFFADAKLGNIGTLDFTVSYDAAYATLLSATPGAGFDLGDANPSAPGQIMVALASVEGYATGTATPLAELRLQLGAGVGSLNLGVGSVVVDEVARDGTQVLLVPESVTAPIEVTVDTSAAVITSVADVSVQEGQNPLYDANTSDANATWGLSGADAQLLQIDANGVVTLRAGVLDTDGANAKASYEFNVEATDLAGNTSLQGVRVGVQNVADTLQGMVYHWKTHALVSDVSLAVNAAQPVDGAGYELKPLANASTAGNGQYAMITDLPGGLLAVQASKSLGAGETGGVINSADALAALKLSVGKSLYADPDGDGPLQAQKASPYQYIAADVNNDGQVTAADALAILKMAVKRGDAVPREWLFVSEQTDFWDESANGGAGAYATDAGHVQWQHDAALVSGQETLNLVAVLKGDVNGSWAAPAASAVVADSHFEQLVLNGVGPAGQWGTLIV